MADDSPDARRTGTLWLNVGLVAGALLVTGAVHPRWIPAAVFALAVFMYIRPHSRLRASRAYDDEGVGGRR
ncbi:hypothetical protein [Clavibacter capsici]|uniref:hypothetical protein n=1 Tax=Clavibacter capsici TaxID=1874630 RepID=UPI0014281083|nr:hypothetical protein [Clavibacter capsici]QIS40101.1 hypothetical protein GW572_13805 [Clavibacter capsici]